MPRRDPPPALRIGVDTGGTFTDFLVEDGGRIRHLKRPSTPDDPARAVLEGLASLGVTGRDSGLAELCHGTTVGTNAVLTRGGARTALLMTAGFEDLLQFGRGTRAELYALAPDRETPLIPAMRCLGVRERVDVRGRVLEALAPAETERLAKRLLRAGVESVAVCLLHAPRRAAHERALARGLRRAGLRVSLSSAVCTDPREVERARTAVLDAYVAPVVGAYVRRLERGVPRGSLTVLRSDGGRMTPAAVRAAPVRTLLSGPAAGVAAARALAQAHGIPSALSFDVGGTSTDVAWIPDGTLPLGETLRVGPFEASVPSVDILTVGAGGGSLVRLDAGGALCVGPESAGADPGPACYGRGGPLALTDALLLLGRLPVSLLAGGFDLDPGAARARARPLAAQAGLGLTAFCRGVEQVAAVATARTLREVAARAGADPRGAALIAFGGAGPTLACRTAESLGVTRVIVPEAPGLFAAAGALHAPLRADAAALAPLGGSASALTRLAQRLRRQVERALQAQGASWHACIAEVEARYAGQAFCVHVPLSGWRAAFHDAHARVHGFSDPTRPVECVRVHVRGEGGRRTQPTRRARRARRAPLQAAPGRVVSRGDLRASRRLRGPLRIDELTATTYVACGWSVGVLPGGALEMRRDA